MIAEALLANPDMKLKEIYASRDRLEQDGMQAMAKVIAHQKSLEKIEVYQNGSKMGLKYLLTALSQCAETLTYVNFQDNKSINRAIPELIEFITTCKNL